MLSPAVVKMKNTSTLYKSSFGELISLFRKSTDYHFTLKSDYGDGFVQIFNLEKGLQARIWDCCFKNPMELYNSTDSRAGDAYFTLAFFPVTKGLQFTGSGTHFSENTIWNTVLTSAISEYSIRLSPMVRGRCVSISFSKRWLQDNVSESDGGFKNIEEKLFTEESFLLFESMAESEKKLVEELLEISWKKSLGTFYIKSIVLKIISDFFSKRKETYSGNKSHSVGSIAEVEKFLNHHLAGTLPNLKTIAHQFSFSESTLKRHFKKKYGVNISTYFKQKKLEYAQQLMRGKHMSITEAAHILGYKNISHFSALLKNHVESSPKQYK